MKSKQEIEEYLGMKIEPYYIREVESIYGEEQIAYDRYVFGQRIPANYSEEKALPKKVEDALKKLIKESIENNDMETAATCHSILRDNTSSYREVTSIDGLNKEQINKLALHEQEQNEKNKREWEELQARIKTEKEAKEKAEEQARLKAEQEAKQRAEEQARLKAEQEAKQRAEEQARLKAEQEAKEKAEQEEKRQVEERANSDEVDYLIEEISSNNYNAWWGKSVADMDTEIKNKVKTLEDKIKELEQNGEDPEKQKYIQILNDRIENLEDAWEIYTQCFDSKARFSMRSSDSNIFRKYRTNYISISKSIELFERFQNGEEVPELYGQHHRERLEREKEERIRAEQQEKNMLEQEYGLVSIEDRETLQRRLEDIVSKGIFLGADKDNDKKVAEFEKMKQVIPRFEEFKNVYLQLRVAGIEDDLYANMDFQNVSFDDLIERATTILEEKAKAETQRTEIEQPDEIIEEQPEVVTVPEQVMEETIEDEPSVAGETIEDTTVTGTNIDIDSASMMEAHLEYMRNHQTQQTSQVIEDYWKEIHSQQAKVYEQPQPEKIRPREKSIKDEVGDELRRTEQQAQKQDTPSVDLWMNRFNGWYSALYRVSKTVKDKFVKMKSDIIKAISEKLKERTNHRQFNTQEQDTMKGR